eukprot:3079212-Pyramimonas_sp.AAC.1
MATSQHFAAGEPRGDNWGPVQLHPDGPPKNPRKRQRFHTSQPPRGPRGLNGPPYNSTPPDLPGAHE